MAKYTLKQKALATVGAGLFVLGLGGVSYISYSGYREGKEIDAIVTSNDVKEVKRLEDLLRVQNFPRGKRKLTSQEFTEVVNQYQILTNNSLIRKDLEEYDKKVEEVKSSWPLAEVPVTPFFLFYGSFFAGIFSMVLASYGDKKVKVN